MIQGDLEIKRETPENFLEEVRILARDLSRDQSLDLGNQRKVNLDKICTTIFIYRQQK